MYTDVHIKTEVDGVVSEGTIDEALEMVEHAKAGPGEASYATIGPEPPSGARAVQPSKSGMRVYVGRGDGAVLRPHLRADEFIADPPDAYRYRELIAPSLRKDQVVASSSGGAIKAPSSIGSLSRDCGSSLPMGRAGE